MKSLLKRLYHSICGPMPLSEFKNYNEYWEKRKTQHDNPADGASQDIPLHRYVSIANQIPEGSSVLDVGCGDGGFLRYLKKRDKNLSLFGMDISTAAVADLSRHGIDGAA
jgi:cyclopropane fatty-acyl-phospholipid synthase-like methyltransferase